MEDKTSKDQKKIAEIEKELEKCKKERDDYLAGWQRTQADFINYKKNQLENIEKAREGSKKEILLEILEVFDLLELDKREIPEEEKDSDWVQGIFKIENQFKKFLKDKNIKELNPEGEDFNPNFHEAVEQIDSNKESGKIVEVLTKGYIKEGQLLRPAKVKVSI